MRLPFTEREFFEAFAAYNSAIWPAQIILMALALLATGAAFSCRSSPARHFVAFVLAFLWAFAALMYHAAYFARVTPAAYGFAALFLIGAIMILRRKDSLAFGDASPRRRALGAAVIVYALAGYPLVGWIVGQRFPATPTFGAPCPLVIFTVGLLLTAKPPMPASLVTVSAIWTVFGTFAAVGFHVYEDFGLTAATLIAIAVAGWDRSSPKVLEERGCAVQSPRDRAADSTT